MGAVALNRISDSLANLVHTILTHLELQAQGRAIKLVCEHEAYLTSQEMVAMFDLFTSDADTAKSYVAITERNLGEVVRVCTVVPPVGPS